MSYQRLGSYFPLLTLTLTPLSTYILYTLYMVLNHAAFLIYNKPFYLFTVLTFYSCKSSAFVLQLAINICSLDIIGIKLLPTF